MASINLVSAIVYNYKHHLIRKLAGYLFPILKIGYQKEIAWELNLLGLGLDELNREGDEPALIFGTEMNRFKIEYENIWNRKYNESGWKNIKPA